MKKILTILSVTTVVLLSACGNSNELSGDWELDKENSDQWCSSGFTFEKTNFDNETVTGDVQSGTYETAENGDYVFTNDDGVTTRRYEITQEDDKNLTMYEKEDKRTCKYVPAS